jgi:hypothetical protein
MVCGGVLNVRGANPHAMACGGGAHLLTLPDDVNNEAQLFADASGDNIRMIQSSDHRASAAECTHKVSANTEPSTSAHAGSDGGSKQV